MSDDASSPLRSCVGCRRRRPVAELVRITRSSAGITVDASSSGRGAWLCRGDQASVLGSLECFDQAIAKKAFARSWKGAVGPDEERKIGQLLGLRAAGDTSRDAH
ncbi:MAG: YlxR family protein [Ilumatobacteraceae bacterium]|nr:YlxR family protein [Ilumatobacteraceae bacterium]